MNSRRAFEAKRNAMTFSRPHVTQQQAHVLVIEDQLEVREAISMLLKAHGYMVSVSSSPEDALECAMRERFELILLDMNYRRDTTSGAEGLELLSQLRASGVDATVIAMTAWGSVEVAVRAMHSGADDFIQKPWDNGHLVTLVAQHIDKQRKRLEVLSRELLEWEEAVAVQRRLLPGTFPSGKGLGIAAFSRPHSYIGGDYYDVFEMGDKIAICIADVVGKGVPAALMMSNLQAVVKVTAAHWLIPSDVCGRVNELVCSIGASDKFISFFYAVMDRSTQEIHYCNCGHNAPILLGAGRSACERLCAGGTVLGLHRNEFFQQGSVTLKPGDRLLLFTDGLSEAESPTGEEFGEDRLTEVLAGASGGNAECILETIVDTASQFCHSNFRDDVTAVLLQTE